MEVTIISKEPAAQAHKPQVSSDITPFLGMLVWLAYALSPKQACPSQPPRPQASVRLRTA